MISRVTICHSRSFTHQVGRFVFTQQAKAGIVDWKATKIPDRSFLVLEEMEAMKQQIQNWNDCNETNLIVLKNCEYIFQDEENARDNCWLNNLALLYEFDLNKIEEAIYSGHQLVNQVYQCFKPVLSINNGVPCGYGRSLACAAHFCVDTSDSEWSVPIFSDNNCFMAPAPGTRYFLDRKMKWKMRQSDAKKILAHALNQSSQTDEARFVGDKINLYLDKSFGRQKDFLQNGHSWLFEGCNSRVESSLPEQLGHDYLHALKHLEELKRSSFDSFHYNIEKPKVSQSEYQYQFPGDRY